MAGKRPWDKRRIKLQRVLREVRVDAGLSQVELAKKLKADQSFVSRFERGERRLDLVELAEISEACGLTLTQLVGRFEKA
jgi:transcriptional regulator with XRE-family HTH domain